MAERFTGGGGRGRTGSSRRDTQEEQQQEEEETQQQSGDGDDQQEVSEPPRIDHTTIQEETDDPTRQRDNDPVEDDPLQERVDHSAVRVLEPDDATQQGGTIGQQARGFQQEIMRERGIQDPAMLRVDQRGDQLVPAFTTFGQEKMERRARWEAREKAASNFQSLGPEDFEVIDGEVRAKEGTGERVAQQQFSERVGDTGAMPSSGEGQAGMRMGDFFGVPQADPVENREVAQPESGGRQTSDQFTSGGPSGPSSFFGVPDGETQDDSQFGGPAFDSGETVDRGIFAGTVLPDRGLETVETDQAAQPGSGGRADVDQFTSGGPGGPSTFDQSLEDSGDEGGGTTSEIFGGVESFYANTREDISPRALMSLDDPEALEARAEKEEGMFDTAEGALDFGEDFDIQDAIWTQEESQAVLGVGGELAGRGIMQFGAEVEERTTFGIGPEVGGSNVGDVPGEVAGMLIGGAGSGVAATATLPWSVSQDIESMEAGEATPTQLQGGGFETGVQFAGTQLEMAQEKPLSAGVAFGLPVAAGVPAGVRGFRATRGTRGRSVEFGDITSQRALETGELPEFRTDPGASTSRAVGEVRQRAAEQPEIVQQAAGSEQVLFHTTENPLPRNLRVTEGASELPGLWTSPDASPLRLDIGARSQTSPIFGRGDWSLTPDQVAAFESPRIQGMPETATGAAHAVRRGGEVRETGLSRAEANRIVAERGGERVPDPTTSGFEFLSTEAEPGTAFVRPRGGRTSELEAIFPPESRFAGSDRIGVEMPTGETIPMDIFRMGEQSARVSEGVAGEARGATGSEISSQFTTFGEVTGQPSVTPAPTVGGLSAAGSASSLFSERTTTDQSGETTFRGEEVSTSPTEMTSLFSGVGTSAFTSTAVSDVFTGAPASTSVSDPSSTPVSGASSSIFGGPTSAAPTGGSSEPPSGPPSSPPTSPPTRPPSEPPSSPPSEPPSEHIPPFPSFDPAGTPRAATPSGEIADRSGNEQLDRSPFGSEFTNPIATGADLLFGGGDGRVSDDEVESMFGGFGEGTEGITDIFGGGTESDGDFNPFGF